MRSILVLLSGALVVAALSLPGPVVGSAAPQSAGQGQAAAPTAARCEFIGTKRDTACMLPFPNNYFTRRDNQTRTGRIVKFQTAAMPANTSGVGIDAAPYAHNDGFSPGQTIVVKAPGLDNQEALKRTRAVGLRHLKRYSRTDAPVVVIDADSGERHPIWVEIDSNAPTPDQAAVLIHPAVNFESGHTYIVAMRRLKDRTGKALTAPRGFRYYRDDVASADSAVNKRRRHFDRMFATLENSGIKRSGLYLAWDFTVASDMNIAGRVLSMRNRALRELGETTTADSVVDGVAPQFTVDSVVEDAIPGQARQIRGTYSVPCYLTPSCADDVNGVFALGSGGKPVKTGAYSVEYICNIPESADKSPARPSLFGHGLFGSPESVAGGYMTAFADSHNFALCATTQIGLSGKDLPRAATVLSDFGKFPIIGDRLQQALVNEIYLGRLMAHPDGFLAHPAFRSGGAAAGSPAFSSGRVFYRGISLGGILGGAYTAIATDTRRSSLVVNGMNFSVLLNRSTAWQDYGFVADAAYPNRLDQALGLAMIQMLWDRGEANGYAHRMTTDPLPKTPKHKVLMDVAVGDFLVSNFQADVLARTIGARAHKPALYRGRWPNMDLLYGVKRISDYPFKGSGIFYWDSGPKDWEPGKGVPTPPIRNRYPTVGKNPHGLPGAEPRAWQSASDFLRNPGKSRIKDPCDGPCYTDGFPGP